MSASPSARKSFRSINGRKQLKQPSGLLPWRAGAGELTFGWSICDTGILTSGVMSPGALVLIGAEELLSEAEVIMSYLGSSHGNRAALQSVAMLMRERPTGCSITINSSSGVGYVLRYFTIF